MTVTVHNGCAVRVLHGHPCCPRCRKPLTERAIRRVFCGKCFTYLDPQLWVKREDRP